MSKLLIRNARLVDESVVDILVEDQIIKKIDSHIECEEDVKIIELDKDSYLSAGWIDAHTHCFEKFKLYSDNCETIGYQSGVTAVVDAGTAGADNIDEFYQQVKDCTTRVFSLLNISKTGIYAQNELADLNHIDQDAFIKAYEKYPEFIIGVKARMSKSVVGDNGDLPLFKAIEIANKVELPLMVHIGTAPSKIDTVLNNLRENDIVTHIFNPKVNGILDKNNEIRASVFGAMEKGVYFDLGHGTDSFSFDVLKRANEENIKLDTISSDIYFRNRENGPVYDLATTMNKLYNRGYTLQEVIDCVTAHPAKMYSLNQLGQIKEGYYADFTIFKIIKGKKELIDSTKKKVIVDEYIQPVSVIIKDQYIHIEEKENGKCL